MHIILKNRFAQGLVSCLHDLFLKIKEDTTISFYRSNRISNSASTLMIGFKNSSVTSVS
jgi:hypothetical protein